MTFSESQVFILKVHKFSPGVRNALWSGQVGTSLHVSWGTLAFQNKVTWRGSIN